MTGRWQRDGTTMVDPIAVPPPCAVMLAKATGASIPVGDFLYEPKWDGFRCLVFRLADTVVLQSRSEEDISYAFPELCRAAAALPVGAVLDGELAVLQDGRVDFALLSSRLRPRSEVGGNIDVMALRHPAVFIAFDLLGLPGRDVRAEPVRLRRELLSGLTLPPGMHLTPATTDPSKAQEWFDQVPGAGLDGLIAKPLAGPYTPGVRSLLKVKHEYTADVVVAAWRPYTKPGPDGEPQVGSLVLGLHDSDGRLHHVGSASGFSAKTRIELTALLGVDTLSEDQPHPWASAADDVRVPDTPNRWQRRAGRPLHLLDPTRVAEVRYDGFADGRFRHPARLVRWRPDRTAASCGFDQLDIPEPVTVDSLFALR